MLTKKPTSTSFSVSTSQNTSAELPKWSVEWITTRTTAIYGDSQSGQVRFCSSGLRSRTFLTTSSFTLKTLWTRTSLPVKEETARKSTPKPVKECWWFSSLSLPPQSCWRTSFSTTSKRDSENLRIKRIWLLLKDCFHSVHNVLESMKMRSKKIKSRPTTPTLHQRLMSTSLLLLQMLKTNLTRRPLFHHRTTLSWDASTTCRIHINEQLQEEKGTQLTKSGEENSSEHYLTSLLNSIHSFTNNRFL